jgi:hypothetical protein
MAVEVVHAVLVVLEDESEVVSRLRLNSMMLGQLLLANMFLELLVPGPVPVLVLGHLPNSHEDYLV